MAGKSKGLKSGEDSTGLDASSSTNVYRFIPKAKRNQEAAASEDPLRVPDPAVERPIGDDDDPGPSAA